MLPICHFKRSVSAHWLASPPNICTLSHDAIHFHSRQLPMATSDTDASTSTARVQKEREHLLDAPPTVICPYLLLGSQRDADDADMLKRMGIIAILNVTPDAPARHHGIDITYKQLPVRIFSALTDHICR